MMKGSVILSDQTTQTPPESLKNYVSAAYQAKEKNYLSWRVFEVRLEDAWRLLATSLGKLLFWWCSKMTTIGKDFSNVAKKCFWGSSQSGMEGCELWQSTRPAKLPQILRTKITNQLTGLLLSTWSFRKGQEPSLICSKLQIQQCFCSTPKEQLIISETYSRSVSKGKLYNCLLGNQKASVGWLPINRHQRAEWAYCSNFSKIHHHIMVQVECIYNSIKQELTGMDNKGWQDALQ